MYYRLSPNWKRKTYQGNQEGGGQQDPTHLTLTLQYSIFANLLKLSKFGEFGELTFRVRKGNKAASELFWWETVTPFSFNNSAIGQL